MKDSLREVENKLWRAKRERYRDSIIIIQKEKNVRLRREEIIYQKKKSKQRKIFIEILDEYNLDEPFRSRALKEFDNENGVISINKNTVHLNGWKDLLIDIGPRVMEIRTQDKY